MKGILLDHNIEVGVFESDVGVVVCEFQHLEPFLMHIALDDRKEYIKELLKNAPPNDHTRGVMYPMGGGGCLIWLSPLANEQQLVHEIAHAVFYMMDAKGIRLSHDSEEVFAYLHGYLYDRMIHAFHQYKQGKPKKL